MSKKETKRKLSYNRVLSSYQRRRHISKRRGFSKSSISKRMTCRSSNNEDSFVHKLAKSSNMNSLNDLVNETGSKHLSINSKDLELSPKQKEDDEQSARTL